MDTHPHLTPCIFSSFFLLLYNSFTSTSTTTVLCTWSFVRFLPGESLLRLFPQAPEGSEVSNRTGSGLTSGGIGGALGNDTCLHYNPAIKHVFCKKMQAETVLYNWIFICATFNMKIYSKDIYIFSKRCTYLCYSQNLGEAVWEVLWQGLTPRYPQVVLKLEGTRREPCLLGGIIIMANHLNNGNHFPQSP